MLVVDTGDHLEAAPVLHPQWAARKKLMQWLLLHPTVVNATERFKGTPTTNIVDAKSCVYVCQKEFATASEQRPTLLGTDEVTTCIGLAIRNPTSGLTCVAHLDNYRCLEEGLKQMLASLHATEDSVLEVHMVGAYDDSLDSDAGYENVGGEEEQPEGYSLPLSLHLIEDLHASPFKMKVKTACIWQHNTRIANSGYAVPVVRGFAIETASGRCTPAKFSDYARGPDTILRGLSLSFTESYELAKRYDHASDTLAINPFKWIEGWKEGAARLLEMPAEEFLKFCSTSPHAESADFVPSMIRQYEYLYNHPDWRDSFPDNQPRKYLRDSKGEWARIF